MDAPAVHKPATDIGFGGSLLGSTTPAESRRLLQAAYEHGIRHFDVAPMYAHGQAETLLREALGTRLQHVSVTTKYGLLPPAQSHLRRFARAALSPFPTLKRRFRQVAPPAPEPIEDPELPPLTAAEAQRSIDRSLQRLGVDRLDLFLLHEATPGRLTDPNLLETLERNREAGKIRRFGIGSRAARVEACLAHHEAYCSVVQYEWSIFTPARPLLEQRPRVLHGSLGSVSPHQSARLEQWFRGVGGDLREPGMLARLLLRASLLHNAGHTVLFSTRSVANIQTNVATAHDPSLDAPARALRAAVQGMPT